MAEGQALYARTARHATVPGRRGYDYDTQKYPRLGTVESHRAHPHGPRPVGFLHRRVRGQPESALRGLPLALQELSQDARIRQSAPGRHLGPLTLPAQRLGADAARSCSSRAEDRPDVFYRGYDVFDFEKVGYIADVEQEGAREFFRYDTRVTGNSNSGHEGKAYGTHLAPEQKDAIVEYMKTL